MKNKGFTLIELLAVIVILAIVALIATPVILNIIDNSREESNQRSVDNYAKAVTTAVARYQLNKKQTLSGTFVPLNNNSGKKLVNTQDSKMVLDVEYEGTEVICEIINISASGKVTMNECTVGDYEGKKYSYGETSNSSSQTPEKVCRAIQGNGTNLGDIIECDTEKFYVLRKVGSNIEMLTEKFIGPISDVVSTSATITEVIKQMDNAGTIDFISSDTQYNEYWRDNPKYDLSEGNWPVYVYEESSLVYPYVEEYKNYLTNNLKINVVDAKLLNYEQIQPFGCSTGYDPSYGATWECTSLPSWMGGNPYYTGLINSYADLHYSLVLPADTSIYEIGIRPVITISQDELN